MCNVRYVTIDRKQISSGESLNNHITFGFVLKVNYVECVLQHRTHNDRGSVASTISYFK